TGVGNVFRTRTGSLIGTPVYMSPEQCRGAGEVDERTDIYSLGCVLYQMLCGRPPFVGQGHGDLITMHMTVPPVPPRQIEPSVPEWLDRFILRMLAKNPDDRPADMAEVIAELDRLSAMPTATPPPPMTARLATGTPAPPTTVVPSAVDLMLTTPVGRQPRRRRWPLVVAGAAAIAGLVAVAVAVRGGRGPEVPTVEAHPAAAEEPGAAPPVTAPPPAVVAEVEPAEPEPAEVEPVATAEPPARSERRPPARSKRRKAREPAPRPKPETEARPTRVRGGIAEPDL
ncbi:MAG TPA: hypothetical protein VFU21_12745, partial [Kofleriaceae bacterium]|nr:hypothetical protein [Kofleriaceae bacterium]